MREKNDSPPFKGESVNRVCKCTKKNPICNNFKMGKFTALTFLNKGIFYPC